MSAHSSASVTYVVETNVAHIELNRPRALNAWTPEMGVELLEAVQRASEDPEVRCVLVTGAGKAFSAGADVKSKRELTPDGHPDLSTRLINIYNPIVSAIRSSPKPFVAAVHGACAGLGVSLALACDLLVASENAYFLLAFIHIAVMPDGGSTSFLADRVGFARAAELCMLGERLPAHEALRWGIVTAVVTDAEFHAEARAVSSRLSEWDISAVQALKSGLAEERTSALETQLSLEAELQQQHGSSADYAEGRAAFEAKRRPRFLGK